MKVHFEVLLELAGKVATQSKVADVPVDVVLLTPFTKELKRRFLVTIISIGQRLTAVKISHFVKLGSKVECMRVRYQGFT